MRANDIAGHIIHINSLGGHRVIYFPDLNVYSASKFAVTALTETLRRELQANKLKIKVTVSWPDNTGRCGGLFLLLERQPGCCGH